MKMKQVKFVCDKCGKGTDYENELDLHNKNKFEEHPFPHREGWVYVYNLQIKRFGMNLVLRDNHFCCNECFIETIKEELNKAKEALLKKLK